MRTPNLTSPNRRPTAEDTVRPSAAKTDSNRSPEVSSSSAPRPAHADHPDAFENLAGNTGSHSALQQTPSLSEWQKLAESTKAEVATLAPKEKIAFLQALAQGGVTLTEAERVELISKILSTAKEGASFDHLLNFSGARKLEEIMQRDSNTLFAQLKDSFTSSVTPGDWQGFHDYVDQVTGSKRTIENDINLVLDDEFLPVIENEIGLAQESIDLMLFQLQADPVGYRIADQLAKRAAEGLKVRVLLDEYGSIKENTGGEKLVEYLRIHGVEVVVNQTPTLVDHLDHRKIWVMDGKVAYTGGMNVGTHYQVEWHDQQTRVAGPAVRDLENLFVREWQNQGGKSGQWDDQNRSILREQYAGMDTRVLHHRGDKKDQSIKFMYLRAIRTAEKSVQIANPYFADKEIVAALCAAAKRGVKVQVVFPRDNDQKILQEAAESFYGDMIESGVEIYEYAKRMAHHKVAVFDGQIATLGSSNLDARSLEYNDECNLVVDNSDFAKEVQTRIFEADQPDCVRIEKHEPDRLDRIKSAIFRWASKWL